MKTVFFYIGFGMQIMGISLVGLCLFLGIQTGDYSKLQLGQFLLGSLAFYSGYFLRSRV